MNIEHEENPKRQDLILLFYAQQRIERMRGYKEIAPIHEVLFPHLYEIL